MPRYSNIPTVYHKTVLYFKGNRFTSTPCRYKCYYHSLDFFQFISLNFLNIQNILTFICQCFSYSTAITNQFTYSIRFQRSRMVCTFPSTIKSIMAFYPFRSQSDSCGINCYSKMMSRKPIALTRSEYSSRSRESSNKQISSKGTGYPEVQS